MEGVRMLLSQGADETHARDASHDRAVEREEFRKAKEEEEKRWVRIYKCAHSCPPERRSK
jgi:hypothetical protein